MSVNRKVFIVVSVILAMVASTFGTVGYVRQSKRQSTAEHWLQLLSGSKSVQPTQKVAANVGPAVEIIGRGNYPLYRD